MKLIMVKKKKVGKYLNLKEIFLIKVLITKYYFWEIVIQKVYLILSI